MILLVTQNTTVRPQFDNHDFGLVTFLLFAVKTAVKLTCIYLVLEPWWKHGN